MRIAVIDGQGGGIGRHITEKLRRALSEETEIIALGTNSLATAAMMKAVANEGATGENAIVQTSKKVHIITGAVSILVANSMFCEVTPKIAEAVGSAEAIKVLLPVNRSNIEIVGAVNEPLPHQVDKIVDFIKKYGGNHNV